MKFSRISRNWDKLCLAGAQWFQIGINKDYRGKDYRGMPYSRNDFKLNEELKLYNIIYLNLRVLGGITVNSNNIPCILKRKIINSTQYPFFAFFLHFKVSERDPRNQPRHFFSWWNAHYTVILYDYRIAVSWLQHQL